MPAVVLFLIALLATGAVGAREIVLTKDGADDLRSEATGLQENLNRLEGAYSDIQADLASVEKRLGDALEKKRALERKSRKLAESVASRGRQRCQGNPSNQAFRAKDIAVLGMECDSAVGFVSQWINTCAGTDACPTDTNSYDNAFACETLSGTGATTDPVRLTCTKQGGGSLSFAWFIK